MNYERVLQKCVASVYPGTAADCNSDFYVANGRGLPICCGDNIAIDNDQGEEELIPWSLGMYIKLSNVRYASKARFYCIKKDLGIKLIFVYESNVYCVIIILILLP